MSAATPMPSKPGAEEGDDSEPQPFGAPIPRAFRLTEVERIAARRLDGAAQGSLKEALATRIVEVVPQPASLGERLQSMDTNDDQAPAHWRAFQAAPEPIFGWINAVPPAHAVPCFEASEPPDEALSEAVAMMPDPCLETHWVREWSAPPPSQEMHPVRLPVHPDAADAEPGSAPDFSAAVVTPAVEAWPAATEPDAASCPPMPDFHVESTEAAVQSLQPSGPADEVPLADPLRRAHEANQRLAADAAAAAETLQHLKRLLAEQAGAASSPQASPSEPPSAGEEIGVAAAPVAAPASTSETQEVAGDAPGPQHVAASLQDAVHNLPVVAESVPPPLPTPHLARDRRPVMPSDVPQEELPKCVVGKLEPRAVARRVPPALPQPGAVPERRPTAAAPAPTKASSLVRDVRSRRKVANEPRHGFEFRGFAAGFALSGAIGVVLYYVMSAG